MLSSDWDYIDVLLSENIISGPVLELGAGYGGATARAKIEAARL